MSKRKSQGLDLAWSDTQCLTTIKIGAMHNV